MFLCNIELTTPCFLDASKNFIIYTLLAPGSPCGKVFLVNIGRRDFNSDSDLFNLGFIHLCHICCKYKTNAVKVNVPFTVVKLEILRRAGLPRKYV